MDANHRYNHDFCRSGPPNPIPLSVSLRSLWQTFRGLKIRHIEPQRATEGHRDKKDGFLLGLEPQIQFSSLCFLVFSAANLLFNPKKKFLSVSICVDWRSFAVIFSGMEE